MRFFTVLFLLLLSVAGIAADGVAGPYRLSAYTEPELVPVGRARLIVEIRDEHGKPVAAKVVRVLAKMPNMSMGEREETAIPGSTAGSYSAPVTFSMAGAYEVSITVDGPLGTGHAVVSMTTGQDSRQGTASVPALLIYGVGGMALIAFVLWRMRRTGQGFKPSSIFSRGVILSLGLLGVALLAAMWAVQNLRREGAMTPLEAQVMEMNTPAPEGTVPVVLATVEEKPFVDTVTYTGQAVGYVEQEVVARVSGTIVAMSVYVGDHVKRGQVLARLDTSQLDPMVAEKAAGVSSASQGVDVATSEFRQSVNMVEQARAEVSMAESDIAEAKSLLNAAKASRETAQAGVDSAAADLRAADADVASAEADRTYQRQELERMRALYGQGAVSKDEWQRAQADAQKADAAAASARERRVRAASMLRSARSDWARASAEVAAASTRIAKSEANVRAKRAQAATAQSGVQTARAKIGQSRAAVVEANAGLQGASAQRGYAELRAEVDGLVTQRLISPGVLVSPGQAVLRVAQVSPVRLQANVPQADLVRIRVGSKVTALSGRGDPNPVELRISSLSPAVDPTSRMGTVEAIYENRDHRFAPGQFVVLEISVGTGANSLVIPASAVEEESQGTGTLTLVWVATPGVNGDFSVSREEVTVSGRSKDTVAVSAGLKQGQQVVVGPQGLTSGSRVRPVDPPVVATASTVIEITEQGYHPSAVQLDPGKATTLTFLRKVADTCATSVEFPELKIQAETPLNKAVTVVIPAQPKGKVLTFTCPMNMYTGKAVAQ